MGKTRKGVPDGSGPHKDSAQRKLTGDVGRKRLAGQKCPKR